MLREVGKNAPGERPLLPCQLYPQLIGRYKRNLNTGEEGREEQANGNNQKNAHGKLIAKDRFIFIVGS